MKRIKRLIDKFRKWLIIKLGGFTVPYGEIKRYTLNPIRVCASFRQCREDYDMPKEFIKEHLAKLLVEEIVRTNLYRIETCVDYSLCCEIHKMNIVVVDPEEL